MTERVGAEVTSAVHGSTLDDVDGPLPGVAVILQRREDNRLFLARSDAKGQFSFGRLAAGSYLLKTCLQGFNTVEMEITVDPRARSVPLVLKVTLST